MTVAGLHAKRQFCQPAGAGLLEKPGPQTGVEKAVRVTLIDQYLVKTEPILDKRHRIIGTPCIPVRAEIAFKGIGSPVRRGRVDDRREGRTAAEALGIPQRHDKRAMPAHRMAEDALTFHVDGEIGAD